MQIDETLNVVELEEAGNTDKSIPLSKPNSPTKSLAIGRQNCRRNSMVIPFPSMHPGNRLRVLSMTAAEHFESAKSILKDGFGQP